MIKTHLRVLSQISKNDRSMSLSISFKGEQFSNEVMSFACLHNIEKP